MPKQYTLEEAQAYFADEGIEFTPAVEKELRGRGLIAEPGPAPLGVVPADRDPRLASQDAIPVNPVGGQNRYDRDSLFAHLFEGLGQAALPMAKLPPTAGDADTIGKMAARGVGMALGFLPTFGPIGKAVSPLGRAVTAGMQGTKYA